jgi:hypothetical protein
MEKIRKCVRCGSEMIEAGHIIGAGFKLNDREIRSYPIKTAVCPKCHEVSLYIEDKEFDRMTGRALIERKI